VRHAVGVLIARVSGDLGILGEVVAVDRQAALRRVDPGVPDPLPLGASVERAWVAVVDVDLRVRNDPRLRVADVVRALLVVEKVNPGTWVADLLDADVVTSARSPRIAVVVGNTLPIRI
jgi:hypothetical protein